VSVEGAETGAYHGTRAAGKGRKSAMNFKTKNAEQNSQMEQLPTPIDQNPD
jgi:hypothetical protein